MWRLQADTVIDATPTICPTTYMGWGGVGMLRFLQSRSFDLAHDVNATDVDATLT